MGKAWGWAGLAGLVATMGWAPSAQAQSAIEGVWRTVLESEVTIYPCPEGYCGHLTRIVVPTENLSPEEAAAASSMAVEEFTDQRNKDPNLRNRPMLGLQILTLRPADKPNIFDGEIYNPEDGNTYSGYLEMVGPDTVRLNGCVLFNTICRGEDWTRVPAEELQLRFEAEAAAAASGS
ncbi:MAG: DUF2147 domain-containing protein [Devosia sp.]|uniref:DUF2147 domain-containing protein n=1 Tax=Devosia sp. TaxID=1871048 RepID=UPI0024C84388|nr:DUF2147 domain-containing protein [Devosia sp.]UYN99888.1 MAG: DUF2147 domain-containing protein [Devosia sp.]